MALPERRRGDLINDIRQILLFDQLNPAQAAKLRGRLGFAQSLMFGRVGRALLQPITARQYSRGVGRKHPLTPELREAPEWWVSCLDTAVPRTTMFGAPKPVLCYTDASGAGHIGVVILVNGQVLSARTHLPRRFLALKTGIFEYELAAVFFGVFGGYVCQELAGGGLL